MGAIILIDGREFVLGRQTGIGRVIKGIALGLAECLRIEELRICTAFPDAVPTRLRTAKNVSVIKCPRNFLLAELWLIFLSRFASVYISPYPKLPLFVIPSCHTVNTVHDILYITQDAYRRRLKTKFDKFRLKQALKKADLTWYVSRWSLEDTIKHFGIAGKNPRVRHNSMDLHFMPGKQPDDGIVLNRYGLQSGDYILIVGNGLPHKNLGVLLYASRLISRPVVFVGVSESNRRYWISLYPEARAVWVGNVGEEELPAIYRNAFCLAQPSVAEGYGYPPMEAMASGVPVVVSDIPVMREITGGNAIFVAPYAPEQWAKAFESLDELDYYKTMISKGSFWVEQMRGQQGWSRHVSDILELLNL